MAALLDGTLVISGPMQAYIKGLGQSTFATLGQVDADTGIKETRKRTQRKISSAAYGQGTTIDAVYQGQERMLEMRLQEINRQTCRLVMNDYANLGGSDARRDYDLGIPGVLASMYAWELKLAPVYSGTPTRRPTNPNALSSTPNLTTFSSTPILHFQCVAMANDQDLEIAMKADLAEVTIFFQLFPFKESPSDTRLSFFTWTSSI